MAGPLIRRRRWPAMRMRPAPIARRCSIIVSGVEPVAQYQRVAPQFHKVLHGAAPMTGEAILRRIFRGGDLSFYAVKQSDDLTSLKLDRSMTEVRIRKGSRCVIYYSIDKTTVSVRGEITLRRKIDEVAYKTV